MSYSGVKGGFNIGTIIGVILRGLLGLWTMAHIGDT